MAARPWKGAHPAPLGSPPPPSPPRHASCSRARFCSCSWPISSAMLRLPRRPPLAFSMPAAAGEGPLLGASIEATESQSWQQMPPPNGKAAPLQTTVYRGPRRSQLCTKRTAHLACGGTGAARSDAAGGQGAWVGTRGARPRRPPALLLLGSLRRAAAGLHLGTRGTPAPLPAALPHLGSVAGRGSAPGAVFAQRAYASMQSDAHGWQGAALRYLEATQKACQRGDSCRQLRCLPRASPGNLTESAAKAPYPCHTTSPWSANAASASSSNLLLQRGRRQREGHWKVAWAARAWHNHKQALNPRRAAGPASVPKSRELTSC